MDQVNPPWHFKSKDHYFSQIQRLSNCGRYFDELCRSSLAAADALESRCHLDVRCTSDPRFRWVTTNFHLQSLVITFLHGMGCKHEIHTEHNGWSVQLPLPPRMAMDVS